MAIIICATFLQHHQQQQQQNHLSSSSSISSRRYYDGSNSGSNHRAMVNSNNGYGANDYNNVVLGNARNRGRPGAHKSSLSIGTQGQGR